MSNIIPYLLVLIHAYPVITYLITIYTYYVGFISICNGIIGADAIGLPVLFTDCVNVIGSGGASLYLGGD